MTEDYCARPLSFSCAENVLQRGEKLEDVLEKTDKLDSNASVFRYSSDGLERHTLAHVSLCKSNL